MILRLTGLYLHILHYVNLILQLHISFPFAVVFSDAGFRNRLTPVYLPGIGSDTVFLGGWIRIRSISCRILLRRTDEKLPGGSGLGNLLARSHALPVLHPVDCDRCTEAGVKQLLYKKKKTLMIRESRQKNEPRQ